MSFWYRNGGCSNNRQSHRQKNVRAHLVGGALLLTCAVGAVAHAQDRVPPGMVARFDVAQRFQYSDNPDLDVNGTSDFFGRTVLGFGLESIRETDSFFLDLGADIEEGRNGRSSLDVTNYFGDINYTRDTRNARVRFDLGYRVTDANDGISDEEFDQDGNVINQNEGTRTSTNFGLEGAVGREAPIGASFSLRYNRIEYSDTLNTSRQDSDRSNFNGKIDFRITPRITASLNARYEDFNVRGDGVDRETKGFGSVVSLQATQIDTINMSLNYNTIERSGSQTGTNEGLSGAVDWNRQLSNGSLGVRYSSDVSTSNDGRRSFFSVSRRMDLPRGSLSLTLGITGSDTIGNDPLLEVDYTYDLPAGRLTFGLSQRVTTDNQNNEEINTRLRAGYNQEISDLSSFGINISFFNRNELQDVPNDGQRIDVNLNYRYALTQDWGLISGFSHRVSTEDLGADRRSNTIFVGFDRNFSWRP